MPAQRPAIAPNFLYGTAWKEDRTQALTELAQELTALLLWREVRDVASS